MSVEQDSFVGRHIGPTESSVAAMLDLLGYKDLDSFTKAVVPESIAISQHIQEILPEAASESDVISELRQIAAKNTLKKSLIGMGYYGTITPPVIKRNVLENPAWYTAYTPYQPEISQGRLEALFAFQTVISDLTALPISNASMLDEGTAAAEAMTLAKRNHKGNDASIFLMDQNVHPQTKAVVVTRAKPLNIEVIEIDAADLSQLSGRDFFGIIVQYPDTSGEINDFQAAAYITH